jgi:hypothetical protein
MKTSETKIIVLATQSVVRSAAARLMLPGNLKIGPTG